MQNKKIISLFINPISGRGVAIKSGNWLNRQLNARGIDHHLFVTSWPDTLEGCGEAWIVGGDGTVNYFLNKYRKKIAVPLVFFKAGTGNDIFWKLYGNISLEEQLNLALTSTPKSVDVAECNGTLFINSSGIGFDGEVLRSNNMIRAIGGHLGYLLVVLQKIFSFSEPEYSISSSDFSATEKFLLVAINNSSRTGGGFLVTPNASVNDGKLDMLLCKPLSVWKRLRYLPVIERGKHLSLPFITHRLETSISIKANKNLYAHLDGELMSAQEFHFSVLPGFVQVKY